MKLSEIFEHLTVGELSQVFTGGEYGEGITAANRHKLISHINLGLNELHKRFFLREARTSLYLARGLEQYQVEEKDLLKIEQIRLPDDRELLLNDENAAIKVLAKSWNSLRIPTASVDKLLDEEKVPNLVVVYRAQHPILGEREIAQEPDRVEIDLPYSHVWPLLLFVASRVMNPIGSAGGATDYHDGNNYAAKYEQACREIEQYGLVLSRDAEEDTFRQRGWV